MKELKPPKAWEWATEHDQLIFAKIILWAEYKRMQIWYRFIRLQCWWFGCDVKTGGMGGGGYLPDDCYEWWCDRCGSEGMNHVTMYGPEKLDSFREQLQFFFDPCRIYRKYQQKLCRHKETRENTVPKMFGKGEKRFTWCVKCSKFLGAEDVIE